MTHQQAADQERVDKAGLPGVDACRHKGIDVGVSDLDILDASF